MDEKQGCEGNIYVTGESYFWGPFIQLWGLHLSLSIKYDAANNKSLKRRTILGHS